jgi:hypothetical protein
MEHLAHAMSEDQLFENIRDLVKTRPVLDMCHTRDSRGTSAGWPDVPIWGPGGFVFYELKNMIKQPTAAQKRRLLSMSRAGAVAVLRRPIHWHNGTILREVLALTSRARLVPLPPTGTPNGPDREPCGCLVENVELFGHCPGCGAS